MVGFENVAALARRAGLNDGIKGTPAIALGAYQATPLELARAYTAFANGGNLVQPVFVTSFRDRSGVVMNRPQAETRQVLDQRVAFLMVDMLQGVMRSGTAAGVRAHGFLLPAAGKTGTSHDGWFVGFTSQLLCLVWVGFDDYRDLGLEGARSALPIWAEFMLQAARYKQYGEAKPFVAPPGLVRIPIDPQTGEACPGGTAAYFIDGTQPTSLCPPPEEVEVEFAPDGSAIQHVVRTEPDRDRPPKDNP
jgi:penicillin-binding protein 1B